MLILDSETDGLEGDDFLEPGTPEDEREVQDTSANDNDRDYFANGDSEIGAVAPSGAQVTALVAVVRLNGTIPRRPAGAYGASDRVACSTGACSAKPSQHPKQ